MSIYSSFDGHVTGLRGAGNFLASYPDPEGISYLLYKRVVKMFPTKTSRDVGMVDCVSDATGSCMEKPAGGKSPGTRRCSYTVTV